MYYTSGLSKMLDEVFTFPYQTRILDDSFIYDSVKKDKDGNTKIDAVVPGYSKEDLKLEVKDNILKLFSELEGKRFSRQWRLSDSVDIQKIKAECKNGILTISIPVKQKLDNKHTIIIL